MLVRREALTGYLFIAPYLGIGGIFTYGLLIYAFYISFTDLTVSFAQQPPQLIGLRNYIRAFSKPDFRIFLENAFWYFAIVTTFQTIGAILLVVLLNARINGIRFFRTMLYSPSVASSLVISLIFFWLYQQRSFINYALGTSIAWLGEADRILDPILQGLGSTSPPNFFRGPSVAWTAIMALNIFTTIPTFMIMFLAAL